MDPLKRFLNIKEAAIYLGISHWTVRDIAGRGEIPPIKVSHKILRFDIKDIDKFMERKKLKNMRSKPLEPLSVTA
jgi:excisionase family DNA binding protein